jgi:hypothetical protein
MLPRLGPDGRRRKWGKPYGIAQAPAEGVPETDPRSLSQRRGSAAAWPEPQPSTLVLGPGGLAFLMPGFGAGFGIGCLKTILCAAVPTVGCGFLK